MWESSIIYTSTGFLIFYDNCYSKYLYMSLYLGFWTSLVAQTVKCLPTMRKTGVQFLGWEDPLEKEMAIYSSILAWKIPWTEDPFGLQSMGLQRVGHD